ncbi:MMPL family transporter, partial [Mycobacterium montefiorense]
MSEKADVPASSPPFLPRIIVRFAVLIVLLWVGLTAVVNLAIPQLEVVGKTHSVSLSPKDAAAVQAIKHVGQVFHEFASNSSLTIVLEADKPLDNDAHQFYNELMRKLSADTQHIAHIQDFWSDPVTAGGSQSLDDKAAFVVVYLVGNNETQAYNSVHAVEHVVNTTPAPPGVKAYVTGP